MRIKKLYINDENKKLVIHPIEFNDLTLLVGASGVGKTQIINSILALKRIANGQSVNGLNWEIEFETINGNNYIWNGGFEVKAGLFEEFIDENSEEYKKNRPKLLYENLTLSSKTILERNDKVIKLNGTPTVKLSQQQSVISLLNEEQYISDVNYAFNKIILNDQLNSKIAPFQLLNLNISKIENKYKTLSIIQELDTDIRNKLYLAYKNLPKIFTKIKNRFIEVFPQVDDMKIAPLDLDYSDIIDLFKEHPLIQIKEKGIDEWIHQGNISSGMFRTLLQISELYLSAKGTVMLIDEFENSLGINCIDELTSDLMTGGEHKIQFIITSHHPYIINNINFSNWKIVTRKAGDIFTHSAEELKLGKSKHDAFMQLINNDEYTNGIIL